MRGEPYHFPFTENQDLGRLMLHAADVGDMLRRRATVEHRYNIKPHLGAVAMKVRDLVMCAPTAVTGIAVLENHNQFFGQKRVEFRAASKLRNLRRDLR